MCVLGLYSGKFTTSFFPSPVLHVCASPACSESTRPGFRFCATSKALSYGFFSVEEFLQQPFKTKLILGPNARCQEMIDPIHIAIPTFSSSSSYLSPSVSVSLPQSYYRSLYTQDPFLSGRSSSHRFRHGACMANPKPPT